MAEPAPQVEPATAEPAQYAGAARAKPAKPVEAPRVQSVESVGDFLAKLEEYDNFDINDDEFGRVSKVALPKIKQSRHHSYGNFEDKMKMYAKQKKDMSVDFLRPADFENGAAVIHYDEEKGGANLVQKIFNFRNYVTYGEVSRYVVIKEQYCFIFLESTDLKPLYTFELNSNEFTIEIEDNKNPDPESTIVNPTAANNNKSNMSTVLLKSRQLEKLSYQFTFDEKPASAATSKEEKEEEADASGSMAEQFVVAVQRSMKQGQLKIAKQAKEEAKKDDVLFIGRGSMGGKSRHSHYSMDGSDFESVELTFTHEDDPIHALVDHIGEIGISERGTKK